MANEKHLERLRQGVREWNVWRGKNLEQIDLSGASLSRADLSEAVLCGADLSETIFIVSDLNRADLNRADLNRADLSGADLSETSLSEANLSGANLSGANLSGADLDRADLSGANLSEANLSEANLSEANLSGANLSGANLSRANLSGASLSGASLSRTDLHEANLIEAILSRAILSRAILSRAILNRADLSGANLSGANLSGASLSEVDLSKAHFSLTVFAKNDLTSVKGLDTIIHQGSSWIDFRTVIFPALGPILATFLRGAGSSEYLIEAVNGRSLPFQPVPVKVFISFAPSDQSLCQNLRDHLSLLVRLKMIALSHEEVLASDIHLWEEKVSAAFAAFREAQVILLLVSASFLASHQAWKEVIEPALRRHQQGSIRLIPIILRPTDWKGSPLEKLQSLPTDGKPVTEWEHIDTPLTEVSEGIRKVVQPLHEVLTEQAMKRRERDLVIAKLILTTTKAAEKRGTMQKQKKAVEEAEKTCQALQVQLQEAQHHRENLFQVQETLLADLSLLDHTSMTLDEEVHTLDTQIQSREEILKGMINETSK